MPFPATDCERKTLGKIGKRLGKRTLGKVTNIVKPETLLAWHSRLVACKCDGSKKGTAPGRPWTEAELKSLIVCLAKKNISSGYDRAVGVLANLGYTVSNQTVVKILKQRSLAPAPKRKKTTAWKEFIRINGDLLAAADFFTMDVWTAFDLTTDYILFFIRIGNREIHVAEITPHPNHQLITQFAHNVTIDKCGFLVPG